MSQTTAGRASGQPPEQGAESPRGVFGRLFLFLRQVVGELRKVVTPPGTNWSTTSWSSSCSSRS